MAGEFDFDFKRVGQFVVRSPDGEFVSQHTAIEYAQESAIRHAVANAINGAYTIESPTWRLTTMGFGVTPIPAPDYTPDNFSFPSASNVALGATVESAVVAITGINRVVTITVTGGEYSKNGGAYTSAAGTLTVNDTVRLRHTSASEQGTDAVTSVTIGTVTRSFKSTTSSGTQAWSYIGIPYPTDPLPTAIMPVLPTGADGPGWPYDPCTVPNPTWPGDGANNYYCAYNGNDGTAGNGGRGNPTNPRRTLPTGSFPAGTKIFVKGDGTPLPTSRTTNRKEDFTDWRNTLPTFNAAGDFSGQQDICWIVGIGYPRIATRDGADLTNSNHVIFDGIVTDGTTDLTRAGSINASNCNYLTFRNGGQYGPYQDYGAQQFSVSGCTYVMYYRNELAYCGVYDVPGGPDYHGFRPSWRNKYIWMIECHLHHLNGDSSQIGNSNNTNSAADTSHYIYYGGNDSHSNHENSFDHKNSFHVILSENHVHDHDGAGGGGANSTGIIIAQDNEGPHSAYHWALANEVDTCGTAIRCAGNGGTPDKTFIMFNKIRDCSLGLHESHAHPLVDGTAAFYISNTVARCNTAMDINMWQPSFKTDVAVRRNLFYDCGAALPMDDDLGLDVFELVDNWVYNPSGSEVIGGSPDVNTGNHYGVDPQLADPNNNDFRPAPGSPLIGATTEDPAIQLFEDMYGISIRFDQAGAARASTQAIGALEA